MATDPEEESTAGEMGLLEHLGELRFRLVYSVAAVALAACFAFLFASEIFAALNAPYVQAFPGKLLIGTGPAEAFLLKIKAALFVGCILASPILFYQLWRFISPGLYQREKRMMVPFIVAATLLALLGITFCYKVVVPFALQFFYRQYSSVGIEPTVRISEHLSFMIKAMLAFALVFEVPVIAYFLGRLGIINHRTLIRGSRHALVVIFIMAAVLTPPDVLTQLLLAGPLILLYGASILIVKLTGKERDQEPAG